MWCWTLLFMVGLFRSVSSQECPKDYWGVNCDKRCEIHCRSYYGCDKVTGACITSCDYGYWGNYCNDRCPVNCTSSCRKDDGFCTYCRDRAYFYGSCNVSCSEKWPNCKTCTYITSNCRTCYPGYWYTNCEQNCTDSFYECNKNSGECLSCLPRLWGENCSHLCPGDHCSRCRMSDGTCDLCDEGYWGNTCQYTCDLIGCQYSICEKNTGGCEKCKTNYWGDFCNNSCEIENCTRYKYSICSKLTGRPCSECEIGKWGSFCEYNCSENCTGKCRTSDGQCNLCVYGTWGSTCNETCLDEQCEYCNKQTGRCQKCKAGYWNISCDRQCDSSNCESAECDRSTGHCQRCSHGYWGTSCQNTCDLEHCRNNYCDKNSGECKSCELGYWGNKCQNKCDISHCEAQNCLKSDGTCNECEKNFWGDFCNHSCEISDCASVTECSKTDGPKCYYCAIGKWGDTCNITCPDNCNAGCKLSSGDCITDYRATQIVDWPYSAIAGISLGSSIAVGLLFLMVVYLSRQWHWKRVKRRILQDNVPNAALANEYVCAGEEAEISAVCADNGGNVSQSLTDCIGLNELVSQPKTMPTSDNVDDNADYESCDRCVSVTYDNVPDATPYENLFSVSKSRRS